MKVVEKRFALGEKALLQGMDGVRWRAGRWGDHGKGRAGRTELLGNVMMKRVGYG